MNVAANADTLAVLASQSVTAKRFSAHALIFMANNTDAV